ncbi:autophagy-related protein 2 [Marasmius crinis-equi]|uniref:Autophagy-related protein 2 n=1 Tax=Marasmius crinis-equi TaxID=585013 RepID=A0ABR3G128_9AGAR
MFPWLSSWLPSLPSTDYFSLPSSIQGRFISFVLKRSLGHFLKPGQLDPQQIDSQVGSGYIQVNSLELDTRAVNDLLIGLPLALETGSIGSVKARIPWPNPLTAAIGFSLESLHLTFRVQEDHTGTTHVDLAESVASVAETFLHEELDSAEEARLKESFRGESLADLEEHNVPGGINPFLAAPEEVAQTDLDPEGVSLFAVLIERLLARFQCDAKDTRVTIIDSTGNGVTLAVEELRYHTDISEEEEKQGNAGQLGESEGEVRKLAVSGITVNVLRTPRSRPSPPDTGRASPASSDSSIDANAQWAMSQSLAFLPPRSGSPDSTASASMYQSAISTHTPEVSAVSAESIHEGNPESIPSPGGPNEISDTLISFGPEPIVVRLTTPPLRAANTSPSFNIKVSAKVGIIRMAVRAWHIRCLSSLADTFTSHTTPSSSSSSASTESGSTLGSGMQASLDVGGIVVLLLPHARPAGSSHDSALNRFFVHPLAPLALTEGYLRFNVDSISLAASINPSSTKSSTLSLSSTLTIGDFALFAFHPKGTGRGTEPGIVTTPILITDPLLPTQYTSQHVHPGSATGSQDEINMPVFEVLDWTSDKVLHYGTKLSSWRTKQKQMKSPRRRGSAPDSGQADNIAVHVRLRKMMPTTTGVLSPMEVEANLVSSLQIFLDIRWLAVDSGILAFVEEISGAFGAEEETSPATPKQDRVVSERILMRSQALKELDLDLNYLEGEEVPTSPTQRARREGQARKACFPARSKGTESSLHVTLGLPMVRIQVRCPPATGQSLRSGAVVVDVRDMKFVIGEKRTTTKTASFGETPSERRLEGKVLLLVEIGRILASLAPPGTDKATAFLSLGGLARSSEFEESRTDLPDLRPRIAITESKPSRSDIPVTSTLNLDFPSLVATLSKSNVDALQYWADDVSQTLQAAATGSASGDSGSRDTSIIGSRYFVQSRGGSGTASMLSEPKERKGDFVVKTSVHEAFVRILLPRQQEEGSVSRPIDVLASELDVLVEVKPEGKDQTFITLAATDLSAINYTPSHSPITLISLTSPRNLLLLSQPLLKLRFTSLEIPGTTSKESRIRISLCGFTYNFSTDMAWMTDLATFASAPPGAFETVVPSERTSLVAKVMNGSIKVTAPNHPGALVVHMGEVEFTTDLIGNAPTFSFKLAVPSLALLAIDDAGDCVDSEVQSSEGVLFWMKRGHALLTEIAGLKLSFESSKGAPPDTKVIIDQLSLRLHICADTMAAVTAFIDDLVSTFSPPSTDPPPRRRKRPTVISESQEEQASNMMSSIDDLAFKRIPQIGPAPDMIYDDLPTNPDYLDESFGAAAGLRELRDEDLDDFDDSYIGPVTSVEEAQRPGLISKFGGETIRMLRPEGLHTVENYFDHLPPETTDDSASLGETSLQVRIRNSNVNVQLYDGYDWAYTRRTIENEVKEIRKRLAKIRQLVANGQTQETDPEETSAVLFNSVYIGLQQDVNELEPDALVAAIDEELKIDLETASQGSWQTLPAPSSKPASQTTRTTSRRLTRSRGSSIEFQVLGLNATFDQYRPSEQLVSKVFATVENLEILDHIKTSTWKKFLTALRSDSRGNIRETGSSMVRAELRTLRPVVDDPSEESRLRLKILPLRLHVDQDALDFLKKFFAFKDPRVVSVPPDPDEGIYFQLAEVFPVDLKLDYKPRRVDYRALREGRTIELMNFFHFDGAEMTLRHITVSGITGWPRLGELLNDLWTPDVKATQLVEVISGVSPIRSVVNVGSGIADLVLLPISQYKKDGRIVRGVQKGTTAFVKSTATEAIKLGARLATGTQVILEQAEGVLGNEFKHPVTAETLLDRDEFTEEDMDLISKYAEQPMNLKEGVHSAYKSLQQNLNSAAQTILAVPMEVYERSGNEVRALSSLWTVPTTQKDMQGPVRSVIRAVPIAVLRPMIGASEAVSKTLLGLHNTLDPNVHHDHDAKYKHRGN